MRHKIVGRKLSRPTGHRISMYYNLARELINHEKITTTEPKAKEVRGVAHKIITLGISGSLHARRQALAMIEDKKIIDKVFEELATRYKDRNGGYTRILKLGPRVGDGALMVQIELV